MQKDKAMSMFSSFEGSDLATVYGGAGGGGGSSFPMYDPQPPMGPPAPSVQTMNTQQPPIAPGAASHAMPPDVNYAPPNAMYASQAAPTQLYAGPSFWDRLVNKRQEVFKLVALSLVFLLALSIHIMAKHYMKTYVANAFLTPIQEGLVRLSYPVIVILVLWFAKTA